jgi:hypothetical protein
MLCIGCQYIEHTVERIEEINLMPKVGTLSLFGIDQRRFTVDGCKRRGKKKVVPDFLNGCA